MTWGYRVVRSDEGDDKFYEVREVYYDDCGKPTAATARGIGLPAYLKALTLPVLDDDTLAEVEPPISKQALVAAK